MANFAGFDQDVNVSLESKFFSKSQTVENENRQHELSIAIVKMDFFFLFDQALMNIYELAHEFYEASCIQITEYRTKMPLSKKRIPMHVSSPIQTLMQFPWTRRWDSAEHVKIKIATETLILMLLSTIV